MKTQVQTRVRDYLRANGIKQRFISEATGIDECALSNILCLRRELKADELFLICQAIHKNPSDFGETTE